MSETRTADGFSFAGSLDETLERVWRLLSRGVADRHAPERHPTLANVDLYGVPQLRTVVLRSADRAAALLTVHTDIMSAKIAQLQADPRCALHVWNGKQKQQMRMNATAELLTGSSVAEIWARVPAGSRTAYGGAPFPGAPVDHPAAYRAEIDEARFCVLALHLHAIETLCLAPDRHYRAMFAKDDHWIGQWLAP